MVRRFRRRARRVTAVVCAPLLAGSQFLVPAAVGAGVTAVAAGLVVAHPAAAGASSGSVLILSTSVNGGSSSPEAQAVPSGYTVTVASPSAWDAMTTAQFAAYSAIIIGDPSSGGTCASSVPADALSTAATWGPAVTGNVAVLGTAPALAGSQGTSLMQDAIGYAVAGSATGLYVSLNCEYYTAAAGTAVSLLASVEGGGFTVRGHRASCPNSGTVNTWAAENSSQFNGLTSAALASWASPACSVQESFDAWPAGFSAVAYDAGATPTEFTASDGATGQAYVLLGAPVSTATAALAPAVGGELLSGATAGGSNSAAPGASESVTPAADGVNAANGDFTQSHTDFSIPTFGPPLGFIRTYDAQSARQQTVAGTPVAAGAPGSMGYGWTDNWDSWLSVGSPVPGDIYRIAGTGISGTTGTAGNGGPALHAQLQNPFGMAADPQGDLFIADTFNNRVQEVAAYSHTQFGIAMTAGDVYTVAGSATGAAGHSGDGGLATSALLSGPYGVAVDGAGNLYIADAGNNRIQEVPAATGSQWGQSMTASDMYTVAGSASGAAGHSGDGGAASSALLNSPQDVVADGQGNLYIADTFNARVQEVAAATGSQWGQSMTGSDIYTVAGSATGTGGNSGNGGPATSALLTSPAGVAIDPAGDLYIADNQANQVREVAATTSTQWLQSMTGNDIYTVAGSSAGTPGSTGDGTLATSALLHGPWAVAVDASGNLYVADTGNARVQEVPAADGTQWGQPMTAAYTYTVAGTGVSGNSGNAGPATSAKLSAPQALGVDPAGDLFIPDQANNMIREVFATTGPAFPVYPNGAGITITQDDGSQITFYPKSGGACTTPYVPAGGYCALPQDITATLTYSSGANTYTYTPAPGRSYTYAATGSLTAETDTAGNTLTVGYHTPAPGSGNCPASANWCQTITAASGRALTLGYNASNEITSVTDPLGRQWAYGYSSSDLTSATDPMGNKTSYTYGAGNTGNPQLANDLLTITGPNAQPGGPDAGDATVNVYNASGQVKSQTDPLGYKTTLDYTGLNTSTGTGVVRASDPDGNTTVDAYAQGALTAQSAWTGTTLTSETDFGPNLTAGGTVGGSLLDTWTADGNGNITTSTYDGSGNPVTATAPDGVGTQTAMATYQFTSLSQQNCASDAAATSTCTQSAGPSPVAPGGVITPPSSIPPQGITWTLFDTSGNELYTTIGVYPPGGGSTSYAQTTYQLFRGNSVTLGSTNISCTATPPSPSLPCATINADGVVTQLAYNSAGDLTSSSAPDGNGSEQATTTNAYNSDGEQTSTTSPDGNLTGANTGNYTTTTAYNADGRVTSTTQAGGSGATVTPRTTTYGYDGDGNQTTVQDARGYTTTTTYNADDQATLYTNPNGNAALTCYDGDGNPAQSVPPSGVAANNLTPASCPTSYPDGYSTRLAPDATVDTFDASGQSPQETIPAPAGQSGHETTTYVYDGAGNLTKTTAPPTTSGGPNQVTVDTYTSTGQIATQTTGYGTSAAATVSYCYDPNGDQTSVVYPDGNTSGVASCETSYPWVVSSTAHPAQAAYQTTHGYDSAGETVTTTTPATSAAPSGATTTSTYDPAGRRLTSTDPNGVTTTWTYAPPGRVATISYSGSSAHSVTYGYDADGNKTSMSDATGSSSYIYDPFDELTTSTNGAGQNIGYGYNADGKIASISYPLPATATWAATSTVTYGYNHADLLNSVTDFNGNQISIGNNSNSLPSSLTLGTTGDTISTTYDQANKPSAITLTNPSTTLQSFTYSDSQAGNILSETDTPSSSQTPAVYTYDAKGRVTSMTPGTGSALNYAFDPSGNLTTTPTGASASYDNAGELTSSALSGTTTSYTYNADGQRLTAKQGSTTIASGTWNGAGQLTAYNNAAGNMSSATYDGNGMRAASQVTPAGKSQITQGYAWDTVSGLPQMIMDSSSAYIYAAGTVPVEQVSLSNGAVTYLVHDRIGSMRGIVGSSGSLTASTSYDAWGKPQTPNGLLNYTPFGYAGGYTDPTGLVYLVHRYYNPSTGQFISVDPAVSQTRQSYIYANGDPVANTDPTGLWFNDIGCAGFFVEANHEMSCQARTRNGWDGWEETIRLGFWNNAQDYGFGRKKATHRHNLEIQAEINVLTFSNGSRPDINPGRRVYGMTHLDPDGYWDLGAIVVIDENTYFGNNKDRRDTPDGRWLGLLTAHCVWPYMTRVRCFDSINTDGYLGLGGDNPLVSDSWGGGFPPAP